MSENLKEMEEELLELDECIKSLPEWNDYAERLQGKYDLLLREINKIKITSELEALGFGSQPINGWVSYNEWLWKSTHQWMGVFQRRLVDRKIGV